MDKATLEASKRDGSVLARHLRQQGLLPAEYYGSGVENLSLQMDYQDFRRLYRKAGENTVIELIVDGDTKTVLVHNVDYDPVSDNFSHVEFINVRMDEEVTTMVPVTLEGQAPAVKELGGTLVQSLNEIEVRCLPGDLIHEVKLDVSSLVDFHSALHVSDITLPETITLLTDVESTVATVSAPREEEPEEVATEGAEAGEAAEGGEEKAEEGGDE